MADSQSNVRLLVKTKLGVPGARLQLGRDKLRYAAQPLFTSIGARKARLAAAPSATWHVLTPVSDEGLAHPSDVASPWDLCHQLMKSGLGVAGGEQVDFAEPDLQQRWLVGGPARSPSRSLPRRRDPTSKTPATRPCR